MITKFKLFENNSYGLGINLLEKLKFDEFLRKVDINQINDSGYNFLFFAVINNKNNYIIFKFLIDNGIDINYINTKTRNVSNIITFIANKFYHTKYIATHRRDMFKKLIELSIENGVDWNFERNGETFLDIIKLKDEEYYNEIINKYPEKYQEYLKKKEIKRFKI